MVFIHGAYLTAGLTWVAFLGERVLDAVAVIRTGKRDSVAGGEDDDVAR
jgi:hypothetical protein